jgi:hypothetical protein
MDKVTNIKEEIGEVTLTLKNGTKIITPSKTIYTEYASGRKDCTVQIQKPFELGGVAEQPGVKK